MIAIVTIVAPVFAIILAGFTAQRTGYLSDGAGKVLAEFAFKAAMPALLFRATLSAGDLAGEPWLLLAAYFSAMAATWLLASLVATLVLGRPREDVASIAMGACFGNTVMLGIPLALAAFGSETAAPMALLVAVETPLLWIVATLHMELIGKGGGARSLGGLRRIALDLLRNPIVMALVAGTALRALGITLPEIADRILALLAQAAVPSALFALGMSLATYRIRGELPTLTAICLLKGAAYPIVAFLLATYLFELPWVWAQVVILFAAMPVGANAYLFAAHYDRAVGPVSGAIAVSTAIAVVSVSAVLFALRV